MTSRICVLLVAAVVPLAACEKSSSKEPAPSGALSGSDKDLYRHFPSGAHLLFGGNYGKLQKFIESAGLGGKATGVSKLIECVATKDGLKFAGAVTVAGKKSSTLRVAIGGIAPADVEGCAKSAEGVAYTPSDDGNYFTIAGSDRDKGSIAFLKLKDGTLYTRGELSGGSATSMLSPKFKATPREELEGDVTAAAKASVADDAKLNDIVAKVDRSKTFWFAGSLATVGGQVGEAFGSIDVGDGFGLFTSAEVLDSSMGDRLERGFDQAKQMADQLPGGLKSLVDEIKLKRSGDRFTLSINLTADQLTEAMKTASALGLGRRFGL